MEAIFILSLLFTVHKHILPFTIVEKESPDPCGLQSQNKRMYINHLKSPPLDTSFA
jgi:hypothetical protein